MSQNAPRSSFACNSCKSKIFANDPRIRCMICHDYDLCAHCGLGEHFTNNHVASHHAMIYKRSGSREDAPVPATPVNYLNISTVGQSAAHAPPETALFTDGADGADAQDIRHGQFEDVIAAPPLTSQRRPSAPATTATGWKPFFLPDLTPTQTFVDLIDNIFQHLDLAKKGYLERETLSRFEDDMSHPTEYNAWKFNLVSLNGISAQSNADQHLKIFYSIEYHLMQRTSLIWEEHADHGIIGSMPVITRNGFEEFVAIDILTDPDKEWANLSRCLRKYKLRKYRTWGRLPRETCPNSQVPRSKAARRRRKEVFAQTGPAP